MSVSRWEPMNDLMTLRDAMDRLFEQSFIQPGRLLGMGGDGSMAVDLYRQNGNYVVKASLPGVQPQDIDVSVTGDTLTIKGQAKQEQEVKEENVIRRERRVGTFSRTVTLPTPVDTSKANATYENGVLTLTLPVAEQAKPKEIPVQARSSTGQMPGQI